MPLLFSHCSIRNSGICAFRRTRTWRARELAGGSGSAAGNDARLATQCATEHLGKYAQSAVCRQRGLWARRGSTLAPAKECETGGEDWTLGRVVLAATCSLIPSRRRGTLRGLRCMGSSTCTVWIRREVEGRRRFLPPSTFSRILRGSLKAATLDPTAFEDGSADLDRPGGHACGYAGQAIAGAKETADCRTCRRAVDAG